MNVIKHSEAPRFDAGGTTVTGYAAPSRGAADVHLWHLDLAPGSTSPMHHMNCEEVFLVLAGRVAAAVGGSERELSAGDCLILPAETPFTLRVLGDEPCRAVACVPAGPLATLDPDGATFPPPWAQ